MITYAVIGAVVGGCLFLLFAGLCVTSARAEKNSEESLAEIMEKKKLENLPVAGNA